MKTGTQKVAVLGGRGMLGTDLVSACTKSGLDAHVFDLPDFDITNYAQLKQVVNESNLIVNCAAYTNVEKAESEEELAYEINAKAVGRLGELAKVSDAKIIHISTDFVFDGTKRGSYVETDAPNPISAYGRTKLAGEELLVESGCKFCIIRVQWTYGRGGENFVTKLVEAARAGKKLKVVNDQVGSPTATTQASSVICQILKFDTMPTGIFHYAASGFVSRYDMAHFIFGKLGLKVDLQSCKSSDYKSAAERPLNSRFDCGKIEGLLAEQIESWKGPLEQFLE
jgi:dTDP-4-dehydrorhamnose reductase